MIHVNEESIKQALKEKVITKREAQELLATLAWLKKQPAPRKKQTLGTIQHSRSVTP
jgi:hypothetical protein